MPIQAAPPSQHERFYFTDGKLRLQVEDTLYLVHTYLFTTHARNFMPALPGASVHFYTILNDVKRTDFDRLLSCLYPRELMVEEPRTSEEWISILKLASKWEFQSLQKRAISELDSIATPIEKVVLGREYDIPELRLPAYVDLCNSIVPLTEEDGERLGLQDVIKIYRVRQELWGQDINPVSSEDILAKVRAQFLPLRPSPPPSRINASLPPQIPVRPPSPPSFDLSPPPQLLALKDSPKPTKQEDMVIASPTDKSFLLEVAERNRTPSPASSVEDPVTPPPLLQPTRAIVFVPAEKLDSMAEPVMTTKVDWTSMAKPVMTTTTALPSAQVGPSVTPKKQKQAQPPPNPPGTGKKGKKRAAALAAMAAMNGNAYPFL
ncbi:hypothetical protein F5887DRAFT_426338 [Amanita rubescens]|nr:hypothetical protein F5887DRAFT_426338 [Amanita rubescens]